MRAASELITRIHGKPAPAERETRIDLEYIAEVMRAKRVQLDAERDQTPPLRSGFIELPAPDPDREFHAARAITQERERRERLKQPAPPQPATAAPEPEPEIRPGPDTLGPRVLDFGFPGFGIIMPD